MTTKKMFLLFQIRRGVRIAIWRVPADNFQEAVFLVKQEEDHRDGDKYELCSPLLDPQRKNGK